MISHISISPVIASFVANFGVELLSLVTYINYINLYTYEGFQSKKD